MIPNSLRQALILRFPDSDFSNYFAFVESLPPLQSGGHKHHILPRTEFPEFAKVTDNLIRLPVTDHFIAHYHLALSAPRCVSFQRTFYMIANRKQVYRVSVDELPQYAMMYARGQEEFAKFRTPEHQRKAGAVSGKSNAESGWIQKLGASQGKENVINGHLANIRTHESQQRGGVTSGQKHVESGHIIRLGKVQGRVNAENGHLGQVCSFEIRAKGGRASGQKKIENGQIYRMATPESCAKGSKMGNHIRWHVNRGVTKPLCSLCHKEV